MYTHTQNITHRWTEFITIFFLTIWLFIWQSSPEWLEIIAAAQSLRNPIIGRRELSNKQTTHRHTTHYQHWGRGRCSVEINVLRQIKSMLVMPIEPKLNVYSNNWNQREHHLHLNLSLGVQRRKKFRTDYRKKIKIYNIERKKVTAEKWCLLCQST